MHCPIGSSQQPEPRGRVLCQPAMRQQRLSEVRSFDYLTQLISDGASSCTSIPSPSVPLHHTPPLPPPLPAQ